MERRARLEEAARWLLRLDQDDGGDPVRLDPGSSGISPEWYHNKDNEREFDALANFVNGVRSARAHLRTLGDSAPEDAIANDAEGSNRTGLLDPRGPVARPGPQGGESV